MFSLSELAEKRIAFGPKPAPVPKPNKNYPNPNRKYSLFNL